MLAEVGNEDEDIIGDNTSFITVDNAEWDKDEVNAPAETLLPAAECVHHNDQDLQQDFFNFNAFYSQ